ncbi:MAG: sulfite exporter TauE/SafE family protein [Methyloversatilis sp.]|uniref:sulfite exporter TauE/SafE family protein n=1 Tax=Methyloversatilis discipulorum TaxID=1119528 RepID=UPI0019A4C067|nr:sulfite exporter TauE/SafE family protein [Methyloversatilis discipulorum]MBC7206760.1 sulfite exporter TauE/SafE family protein [Methyloversatilis sp.]MBT9516211.1 sulfite exporter TauE/SafE family protein [Methyloversatilis discipulorum]
MKIRHIDTRPTEVGQAHEALGLPPVEQVIDRAQAHPLATVASWFMGFTLFGLAAILLARGLPLGDPSAALDIVIGVVTSDEFLKAAAVGFIAQSIDGALGMAYGISATTFLLGTGASPAVASASVHIAEIFTTGLSGLSHLRLGNVDRKLMLKLLIPGVIGGVLGALVVTKFDGAALKPWISGYLLVMGIYVLAKAWRHRRKPAQEPKHVAKLALFGGFVDAAGGGGWGPVVTTSLVGAGQDPRRTIGSVNFAEFFIAIASAGAFVIFIDAAPWATVAGLVAGGMFAAPLAAFLCRALPARALLVLVGTLISGLSAYNLMKALG